MVDIFEFDFAARYLLNFNTSLKLIFVSLFTLALFCCSSVKFHFVGFAINLLNNNTSVKLICPSPLISPNWYSSEGLSLGTTDTVNVVVFPP